MDMLKPLTIRQEVEPGVRCLRTRLGRGAIEERQKALADTLFRAIPAGVGSRGRIRLKPAEMDRMLDGGAAWAVERGWGEKADLDRIEEGGRMRGARPDHVSERAKTRMRDEVGTLGSGNHYLEVQAVAEVHDAEAARAFGLAEGDVVVSIHCGSRGLGHQIGTEALKEMLGAGRRHGIRLPDRELACAPIRSPEGERYLGAMRAAINVALANRQVLTHLTREVFSEVLPEADLTLLYDVSHNTCKAETHRVDGRPREVFVHRKGATRAQQEDTGIIPGSQGSPSYIVRGKSNPDSFNSCSHGAGRKLGRKQAIRQLRSWKVGFREMDIETNHRAYAEFRRLRARGVPVITIGERHLFGFDAKRLRQLLEEAGISVSG